MIERPIEVVAEIGINHQGDMELAKVMIEQAAKCGADLAKFQVYDPERLLDREHPVIKPWWNVILKTKLTEDMVDTISFWCYQAGIEFFTSVFHAKDVEWLDKYVRRWKIASRSMYDEDLAEAIAETEKPVVVSYGYHDADKGEAVIHNWMGGEIYDLYCVSEYPTQWRDLDFGDPCCSIWPELYWGFSDHTVGTWASCLAMDRGARMIEKHVTLNKGMPGPDHKASITFDELSSLCSWRNMVEGVIYREDRDATTAVQT